MESVVRCGGHLCQSAQRSSGACCLGRSGVSGRLELPCLLGSAELRYLELYFQYQQGVSRLGKEIGIVPEACGGDKGVAGFGDCVVEEVCRGGGPCKGSSVSFVASSKRCVGRCLCVGDGIVNEGCESGSSVGVPEGRDLSDSDILESNGSSRCLGDQYFVGEESGCLRGTGASSQRFVDVAGGPNSQSEGSETGKCQSQVSRLCVKEKTLRNREARVRRKEKKKARQLAHFDWRKSAGVAKASLEEKWKVENELAIERARRKLEVLKSSDVRDEAKRYRTRVSADTEKNMVSIEKTHAMLSATGNVPEVFSGSAQTVVSGEPGLVDGSISPDSSVSMAEVRAMQKENADLKHVVKLFEKNFKVSAENVKYYDKDVWTENEANEAILDELYPDGYGMNPAYTPEGKFQVC